MKPMIVVLAGVVAALGIAYTLIPALASPSVQPTLIAITNAVVVAFAGSASFVIKRRKERTSRSFASDSLERDVAIKVQARVMIDGIIAGLAIGLILLVAETIPAAVGVFGLVAFMVADFWVRYAVRLRQARNSD